MTGVNGKSTLLWDGHTLFICAEACLNMREDVEIVSNEGSLGPTGVFK